MTYRGPWIQPPDSTLTQEHLRYRTSVRQGDGGDLGMVPPPNTGDRDALATHLLNGDSYFPWEGDWGTGAGYGSSDVNISPASDDGNLDYLESDSDVLLSFWVIRFDDLYMPQTITFPIPPGIVGVEFEAVSGTIRTAHLDAVVRLQASTYEAQFGLWVPQNHAAEAYVLLPDAAQFVDTPFAEVPVGPTGNTGNPWWSPPELAAMDVALVASTGGAPTFTDLSLDLDTGRPTAAVVLAAGMHYAGSTAPPNGLTVLADMWSPNWSVAPTGLPQGYQPGPLLTYTYQPPRFRWVFAEAPPQRQFPRDDGLAASTRRSWPARSSRQRGSRRGPDSTYL